MQLKEFSFIAPVIESAAVFKAIETVISPDIIAQTLGNTDSFEERVSQAAISTRGLFSNCYESMVVRFNGNCPQKSRQWIESTVDHPGAVLESAE